MANNNDKFISRENAKTLWGYMIDLLTGKQNKLTFDDTPTQSSDNPVKSGGIFTAMAGKGTYSKPQNGIPKTDLENAVQTSLGLADSALQSETDPTVPSWAKETNKPSYTQDEVGDGTTYKRVSSTEKDTWNAKGTYSKPSGGIPKSDLASAVQSSLEKADSALQSESDPTVPSWAKQTNKPSYTQDEVGDGTTYKRVSSTEKDTWNAKGTYSKPSGGIPKSDLASAVQTSLGKADSALQSESDPTVPSWAKQTNKPSYNSDEISDTNRTHKFATQAQLNQISTNQSNILYGLQTGVKNIIRLNPGTYNNNVATFTVNNDGEVIINSSSAGTSAITIGEFELPAGNYVSWYDNTASDGKCDVRLMNGSTRLSAQFTLSSATTIRADVYSYAVNSNIVIKPMLCTASAWAQEPNVYRKPALPNYDLTRMVSDLQKKAVKVYTYHVNPNESDPEDAVTYLDDATGLTPAKMGASSFSYGSWANAWFLPKPCMLKSDGTVAYYLNPNDYSKKTDGTASDIADSAFDGNVMLEFPKIWVKRVNDGNGARTVSIAPVNVDGTYKCWSNINADNQEVDHFYLPAYNGTIHSSKMRSLSGVTLNATYAPNYNRSQEVTAAAANNPSGKNMWYTETWADMCLVYDLLYLMGKSLDVQRTFGQGLSTGGETAMRAYVTGAHNDKGLFYGDTIGTSTAVKVLGMENLWGCRWHEVAGLINDNGTLKVKMTYGVADGSTTVGYNTTGAGYLNYGSTYGTDGFVKKMQADNTMGYKIIETAGTDATYYCDYYYVNNSQSNYALLGGRSGIGSSCGFYVHLGTGAGIANWYIGGALSCRPQVG